MPTAEPEPTDVTVLVADLRAAAARLRAECTGGGSDRYVQIAAGWLDGWAETASVTTPASPSPA